jgi:hypothetical protein
VGHSTQFDTPIFLLLVPCPALNFSLKWDSMTDRKNTQPHLVPIAQPQIEPAPKFFEIIVRLETLLLAFVTPDQDSPGTLSNLLHLIASQCLDQRHQTITQLGPPL